MDGTPQLVAGTFEPDSIVEGKKVKSWNCVDASHTEYDGGYSYRSVRIHFHDGTSMFATEVRPPITKVKSHISGEFIEVEFPKNLRERS